MSEWLWMGLRVCVYRIWWQRGSSWQGRRPCHHLCPVSNKWSPSMAHAWGTRTCTHSCCTACCAYTHLKISSLGRKYLAAEVAQLCVKKLNAGILHFCKLEISSMFLYQESTVSPTTHHILLLYHGWKGCNRLYSTPNHDLFQTLSKLF